MTWYPFRPVLAIDVEGNVAQSGSGQIYATTDTDYETPLTVVDAQDSPLASVTVSSIGVTPYFKVEGHGEVMWKSGSLPAVSLFSAGGFLTATEAAQAAAEAAEAAATNLADLVTATEDERVAAFIADEDSDTRAALDAAFGAATASVIAYGATGDGLTDDAAAIQAGIDALTAADGGTLFFPAGTYKIESTLNLKSNVRLMGDGAATIDFSEVEKAGSARYGIRATGTLGTSTLLTGNVNPGTHTLGVTSVADLSIGDWVLLGTTGSNYYPYGGDVNVDRGEIKQIRNIADLILAFEQSTYDRYATADAAFVAPIDMVENVAVENLRIVGSRTAAAGDRAIQLDYVNGFRVAGCVIEASDIYCVHLSSAIRGSVIDNRMRGVHYDGETGGVFYAVSVMNASQWVRVIGNHGEQVRHLYVNSAISAGQGHWGQPRFIDVIGNIAQNMMGSSSGRSWAYEHHGFGDAILIANNIADGCYGGFVTRGPGVTFQGNIVRNWWQHAIEIHSQTVDARNIIIRDNQVSGRIITGGGASGPVAIRLQLDNATTVRNVVVEDNTVDVDLTAFGATGGLYATGTAAGGLTVRSNAFIWVGSSASTSWLVRTTLPSATIEDNRVIGSPYGFRVDGAGSDVCGNSGQHTSQQSTGNLVYVDASGCIVQGNRSRLMRYCVQSSSNGTDLTLHSNIGASDSDPFGLGTTTGLDAKVNVWTTGSTSVNN